MDQAAANPRAIFVCENGVAISSYMYLELKDLLPQLDFGGVYSVREFRDQKIECDLIFSTVPLEVPVKTFVLQPMMSEPEKQSFAHQSRCIWPDSIFSQRGGRLYGCDRAVRQGGKQGRINAKA